MNADRQKRINSLAFAMCIEAASRQVFPAVNALVRWDIVHELRKLFLDEGFDWRAFKKTDGKTPGGRS